MTNLFEKFNFYCNSTQSDMKDHLPTLLEYGKKVKHITEFGVREGQSTIAFMCSRPDKIISYDIQFFPAVQNVFDLSQEYNINFYYILHNSLTAEIEETDLLFIDSYHGYNQLKQELTNAPKVKKYIILHDTVTYAYHGHVEGEEGLEKAIQEFLETNQEWKIKERYENCHGLTILEKQN